MRPVRYIPPGSLVEVTGRAYQERFLLRPSPSFNQIVLGALGRAQRLYRVRIHGAVFLSNHYHLLATADSPEQLARFVGYFQAKIAKEVARLHGWTQKIWARRYRAILVSDEPEAQRARLAYLLQHGVKEGLVASPTDWPGVHTAGLRDSRGALHGTWFDRTRQCNAKPRRRPGRNPEPILFPAQETLEITPIPAWQHLTPEACRSLFTELLHQAQQLGRRLQSQTRRPPPGPRAILEQTHHQRPAHAKRSPAPRVHAASLAARRTLCEAYRTFLLAYRAASQRLRQGLTATFPQHCFPPPLPSLRPGDRFGPLTTAL